MQSVPIAPETLSLDAADQNVTTEDESVADQLIHDEFLIEEISIDGMCGVY